MPNLQTRIKLKYDTLENWQLVADTFKPLPGEVCICEVPTGDSLEQTTPPATLCKVGDGVNTWENLPWMSALAADVYKWAKQPTLQISDTGTGLITDITSTANGITVTRTSQAKTLSAAAGNVITGITMDANGTVTSINQAVDKDTNTTYTLTSPSEGAVQLSGGSSVTINGWSKIATAQACASAAYTLATTANNTAASALQKADIVSGSANGTISVKGTDVAVKGLGSAAYTASTAYDAAGAATSAVSTHNNASTAHSDIRSQITALAEKVNGRSTAYVYQNKSDSDYTTAIGKAGSFVIGDTIYFLDTNIPDEWVTAVNASSPYYTFQEIETEKQSLTGYVTGSGLTANKLIVGNAGSAVKASTYDVKTTLTATDTASVPTSNAVATYVTGRGYITSATASTTYAPIATKTTVDGIMAGTTAVPNAEHADSADTATSATTATTATTATNYSASGNIATTFATKFDTVTPSGTAGVVTAVTDGGGTTISVTQTSLATPAPAASGTATAFIDTISQAANGKITVTKKNVQFPTQITPGNGGLKDGTGAVIFTANQSTDTQILVIDCGTASTVVYDVP